MAETKSILLVEDEPLLANLLRQRLEHEGFSVTWNRDGEQAMKTLRDTKPDLVLLDIILPKISGFKLLETMKVDPTIERPPIIIISNLGQDSDVAKGQALGAVQYFVKAKLSIEELVSQVKLFFGMEK
ncbi:MAG: response regulator [Patescibacteria group bacterium]